MALRFLKKLADKLLNKAPASEKTAKGATAKKETRQSSRGAVSKPDRAASSGRQSKGEWRARPQQRSGGTSERRAPHTRDGARSPRASSDAPQSPRGSRLHRNEQSSEKSPTPQRPLQSATGGRSIARPESRRGGGDGGRDRDRHSSRQANTASNARRPGGAVAAEEQEKRNAEHAAWTLEQYQVEPAEGKQRFHDFNLPLEILHAIADKGFQYCTPIQSLSLEHALAGKNVAGRAQTGTGKTAAFLVAILTRYLRTPEARQQQEGTPRALVIAPTRELVIQICKDATDLGKYCNLRSLAVYGGMDYDRQRKELRDAPVDLLVATPGRLLDFVRSHVVDLSKVDTLVIDEADRMLDMGFIPDVRAILSRLPSKDKRGTMLYSATLSEDVMRLASQWMEAPVRVEVESDQVPTKTIKQIVYVVTAREKFTVLFNHILQYPDSRILVFCNRRTTTDDVAVSLSRRGVKCETLSGDVSQNRRLQVLEDFREGKCRIVIATDVAGRGLHVDNIGFVINFDFPYEPEDYVHRIGRTGRAGQTGVAISFADEDESFTIPGIEKYIGEELKCTVLQSDDPLLAALPVPRRRADPAPRTQEKPAAATPAETPAAAAPQPEKKATVTPPPPAKPRAPEHRTTASRPKRTDQPHSEPRRHVEHRRHEDPPPSTNVHKLPPPGAKFSEEWVPGGGK